MRQRYSIVPSICPRPAITYRNLEAWPLRASCLSVSDLLGPAHKRVVFGEGYHVNLLVYDGEADLADYGTVDRAHGIALVVGLGEGRDEREVDLAEEHRYFVLLLAQQKQC